MISLNKHAIDVTINNRYATIDYLFQFKNNSTQPGSNELKFEITIDPTAFISQFKANINGEIFIGTIKERQTTSNEYINAKSNNQNPILIKQTNPEIPNLFTISTNINYQTEITLIITIEQYLIKKFNFNALDIQILRTFDKYSIAQNYDYIALNLNINDYSCIYNILINNKTLHQISQNNHSNIKIDNQNINQTAQKCIINCKLFLKSTFNEIKFQYKLKTEQNESMILYGNKSKTFCHVISDIFNTNICDCEIIPRRVVFIIDKSESMQGNNWTQTINATITALKQLKSGYDKFCVILFAADIHMFPNQKLMLCNEININNTISFLQNCTVESGRNINDALIKGINIIQKDIIFGANSNGFIYMNQMFFITDGIANVCEINTQKIIENIKEINYSERISIFTFGIGSDCNNYNINHSFLKMLAINNYGVYKRIKQSCIEKVLNEYFKMLSKPMLCDINIKYNNKNVSDLTRHKFNALYCGNDLIICGKMNITNQQINVIINGKTSKKGKIINISAKIITNVIVCNSFDNVEKIWAYQTLQQLTENKLILEQNDHEKDIIALKLAQKYKFITHWTSMIIIGNKSDIFLSKIKQIENKIIQHLHARGYSESHPDYHRYMQKAKELAIQKADAIRKRIKIEQLMKTKKKSKNMNKNKYLIILRGLPGSGKTTLANKIVRRNKESQSIICSEDKYHWSNNEYKFQPNLIFNAREWCNNEINASIINGVELIIIDNHNSKLKMYEKHIEFAVQNGYIFKIMEFICNKSLVNKYKQRSYKPFPINIYIKLLQLWENDPRAELINPVFKQQIKNKTILNTFPMKYEIRIQAKVRAEIGLNSSHVTDLPEGTIITVNEIIGNRARISYPIYGWLTVKSIKFNEYIIVPTHIDYEKIGGKIMFKNKIIINGKYFNQGKIIDYDEIRQIYLIKFQNNCLEWISLKNNNNVIFIKDKKYNMKHSNVLNGFAEEFSLQKTDIFFNEFFCRDYPQYQALSSSTKEKMEIGANNINIKTMSNYSRIW